MPKEIISVKLEPELISKINDFLGTDAGSNLAKNRTELMTKAAHLFIDMMEGKPHHITPTRTMIPAEIDRDLLETLNEYCKSEKRKYGHLLELMIAIISPEDKTWFDVGVSALTVNRMGKWLNAIKNEWKKGLNGGAKQ